MFWNNLRLILASPIRLSIYLVSVGLGVWIWWNFTDIEGIIANYGSFHGYWYPVLDITLSLLTIILFPLFIIAWIYRSYTLGGYGGKQERIGFLGGVIGVIISGSSCCGLTLATYFGLLPLLMFLPYNGMELKIVAVIGLVYASIITINRLTYCPLVLKKE